MQRFPPSNPALRRLRCTALSMASVLALVPAMALAQAAYPARTVTIIVPFAAGGTVDNVARNIQERLAQELGQTVIIDNRGGGGGTIGMAALAKATPDGYTIGMVFDSFATEQHIHAQLPYASKDITGAAYMVRSPMVLTASASTPYQTLDEYVQAAQRTDVSYASVGAGSSNHLAAELFHKTAGTQGLHVPYRGGGPAIADLTGGHVDSIIASLPLVLPHVQGGKLRALAVTAAQPVEALPETPPIAQTYPGFEIYSWVGMVAPAQVPEPILDRLAAAVTATLQDPEVTQRLTDAGFEVVAQGRSAMNDLVEQESTRWGQLIKDIELAPQ